MSAPFRIGNQEPTVEGLEPVDYSIKSTTPLQEYLERLLKLIPGEIVGIYLIGTGVIPPDATKGFIGWAFVCLILVIFVRAYGTRDKAEGLPVQWVAVGVAAFSFVLWVYTMPGPLQSFGTGLAFVGSLGILVWTFIVPKFYKGDG